MKFSKYILATIVVAVMFSGCSTAYDNFSFGYDYTKKKIQKVHKIEKAIDDIVTK